MDRRRIEISMKPKCQRILSYVLMHSDATMKELASALPDIPQPSLYRYVRELIGCKALIVSREERHRGGIERYLRMNEEGNAGYPEFSIAMAGMQSSFMEYFRGEDPDPVRDMLSLSGTVLVLDDDEYSALLKGINELVIGAMGRKMEKGRKERQLFIVSAPVKEEK